MIRLAIDGQIRRFGRSPPHCGLVATQPSAPTVFGWNDSMDEKRIGSLSEMPPVAEYSFGVAGVFNFQDWSPVLELFLQSDEGIRTEFSSAPRLFHFWRVIDEVYLRIRTFQQKIMPAGASL